MKLSRLPLLFLLGSAACANDRDNDDSVQPKDSGVEDTGMTDTGVELGFNTREVAAELSAAQCQFITRCAPEYYEAFGTTEAECITESTDSLVEVYEQDLAPLIQAGRLTYNAADKDACVQKLGTADCVLERSGLGLIEGTACDRYLIGTQAANEPCFSAAECGADLYCNRAQGLGTCGACAPAAPSGSTCDPFTPCETFAGCAQVGQGQFQCVPTNAQQGATCLTLETGFCQGSLECIGDQAGTCAPPGGSGAQCDNDPMTFALAECNLFAGFACDGATCSTANWSDLNGICNDTTFCREGYCNGGTCAPLPTTGMSCQAVGACGEDSFCDGTNCVPLKAQGAACNSAAECIGELVCLGAGVNRPGMCGALEWQLCQ